MSQGIPPAGKPQFGLWVGVVVLLRVALALLVWILLFLGMFLGYFTLPILLVSLLMLLYAITDIGLFVTIRRREQARSARQEFLKAQRDLELEKREPS